MKIFALIVILLVFSLPVAAQSFIAIGPEVSTTTSAGAPGGNQTRSGAFVDGQFGFKAGLEFGIGGAMKITNRPRFFDEGSGASFEFEPAGRMYFPISKSGSSQFDIYAVGGMNMQRAADTTVANPLLGFGVRWQGLEAGTERPKTVIDIGYKCLFDDVVGNGLNPTIWRGYELNSRVLRRLGAVGFYFQGGAKWQANTTIAPRRTEIGGAFGVLIF